MNADLRSLKTAFALLIRDVGGVEAAAAATGSHIGRLSEAASLNNPSRWPRMDHVAMLEAIAPHPHGSAALARLCRRELRDLPAASGCLHGALVTSLGGAGGLVKQIAGAMADGDISDNERATLQAQISTTIQDLMQAQSLLTKGDAA
jgi:hypothetical protein